MTLKKKDIRSMTKEDLRVFFKDMGEQPFRGNQVYEWLWSKTAHSFEGMTNLSLTTRNLLEENFTITREAEAVRPGSLHEFGMYLNKNWYRLQAKPGTWTEDPIGVLDVSILSDKVLDKLTKNSKSDVDSTQIDNIISLAESRGDCIAVLDLYAHGATVSNVVGQADSLNSSYAAAYWPWVQMQSATGKNVWAPASTVIPGVYAFTDGASAPWYAPAGLVRGGITGVIQAEKKLSKTDRDTLYDGKVNPIATFPGTGIAVFGQKTLQTKASALDRVNVRRLLIELKEFLGNQAQNLVFEQNTVNTRNKFLSSVNPYLDSVVQRQGLYSYRVVMDDTNNSADVIDRNQLVGQIFIQPAKTAEFIVLDFTVEPTGATFGA